jgi:hypothetical protein
MSESALGYMYYSKFDQLENVLFISEILFDGILDHTGKQCSNESMEELFGNNNSNPLLRSSTLSILDRILTFLDLNLTASKRGDIDLLFLRYLWLRACYEEVFGTPKSTVDSLNKCMEFWDDFEPELTIRREYCNRDRIISFESVETKKRYQRLRLRIDETRDLANQNEFQEVYDRLEPMLSIDISPQESQASSIINEMPYSKQIELLDLLSFSAEKLGNEKTVFAATCKAMKVMLIYISQGSSNIFLNLEKVSLG